MDTYLSVTVLPNLHLLAAIASSLLTAVLLVLGLCYLHADSETQEGNIKKLYVRGSLLLLITTTVLVLTPTREDLYITKTLQHKGLKYGQ